MAPNERHKTQKCFKTTTLDVFTTLQGMQTRSSDKNSVFVCPSVCQTRDLWQQKRNLYRHSYIPHEKPFTILLWQEEWL